MQVERFSRDDPVRFSTVLPRSAPLPTAQLEPLEEEITIQEPAEIKEHTSKYGVGLVSTGPTSLFEVDLAIQRVTEDIKRLEREALIDSKEPLLQLQNELASLKQAQRFQNLPQVNQLGTPVIERAPPCATVADFEQRQEGKAKLIAEARKILEDRNEANLSNLVAGCVAKQSVAGLAIAKPAVEQLKLELLDDAIREIKSQYQFD